MRDDFAASIWQPARYRAQDVAGKGFGQQVRSVGADLLQDSIDEVDPDLHAVGLRNVLEGLLHRSSHVQCNAVRGLGGPQGLADRPQTVR